MMASAWHTKRHSGWVAVMAVVAVPGALRDLDSSPKPPTIPGPSQEHTQSHTPVCAPGDDQLPGNAGLGVHRAPPFPQVRKDNCQGQKEPLTTLSSGTDRLSVHSWLFTKASEKEEDTKSDTTTHVKAKSKYLQWAIFPSEGHRRWCRPASLCRSHSRKISLSQFMTLS